MKLKYNILTLAVLSSLLCFFLKKKHINIKMFLTTCVIMFLSIHKTYEFFTGGGKTRDRYYETDETHSEIESEDESENKGLGSSLENPIIIDDSDEEPNGIEETNGEEKNQWLDTILGDDDQESDADRDFIDDSELDPNFTNEDFLRHWNNIPDISGEFSNDRKQIDIDKLIEDKVSIEMDNRKNLTSEEVEKIRLEVTEEVNKQMEKSKKRGEDLNKRLQALVDIENIRKEKKKANEKSEQKKENKKSEKSEHKKANKKSEKSKKSTPPLKPQKFTRFAKMPK